MYDFILRMAVMVGLGAMIYMVAKASPRVVEETAKKEARRKFLINHQTIEKIDVLLVNFLEKGLRKFKLFLMKLDNFANNYLDKVREGRSNGGQKKEEEKPTLFNGKGKE
jgi:hypothetical protein